MLSTIIAFLLGVFLAPAVRPLFRPVMLEVVRAMFAITDEVKRMSAQVQESVEDAKAEVDAARAAQAASPQTAPQAASAQAAPSPSAPPYAPTTPASAP